MELDLSLPARRVIRALQQAGELYGLQGSIVVDNGPEEHVTGSILPRGRLGHRASLGTLDRSGSPRAVSGT